MLFFSFEFLSDDGKKIDTKTFILKYADFDLSKSQIKKMLKNLEAQCSAILRMTNEDITQNRLVHVNRITNEYFLKVLPEQNIIAYFRLSEHNLIFVYRLQHIY